MNLYSRAKNNQDDCAELTKNHNKGFAAESDVGYVLTILDIPDVGVARGPISFSESAL